METEGIIGLESFDPDQKCFCEEPDETIYARFKYQDKEAIFCPRCGLVRIEIDFGETDTTFEEDISREELPKLDSKLQIIEDNEKVDSPEKAAILTTGSHIAWVRQSGKRLGFIPGNYNHHAVVEKNDGEYLDIIHYAIDVHHNNVIRIHQKQLCLTSHNEMGYYDLYVINYPQRLLQKNPPTLVLERAVSRLGEQLYNPILNNSECYVNFCKTGFSHSLQTSAKLEACIDKLGETLSSFAKKSKVVMWANQFLTEEAIKNSLRSEDFRPRVIEDELHVFTEGMICTSNMDSLYEERRDEDISRDSFEDKLISALVISLAAFLIIGVLAGGAVGGITTGITAGFTTGNLFGAVIGGLVGVSAYWLVKKRSRSKYSNKETITLIDKLRIGDHVIIPNKRAFLDPFHGIVSDIKKIEHRISIIRYLPERVVVEEEMSFKKITRIKYALGECNRPREVVRRARSKLGQVNLPAMDGKTFAESQKKKAKKRVSESELFEETQKEKRLKESLRPGLTTRTFQRTVNDESSIDSEEISMLPVLIQRPLEETESIISKSGANVTIPGTKVLLSIPPGALPEHLDECLIKLRIIPRKGFEDPLITFCSNSSVVVEILPNNLTLQCPAQLYVPHCLLLNENKTQTARIFLSHHEEGCSPCWIEDSKIHYSVEKTHCVVWLNSFCWITVKVDDKEVFAKKLILYTCGKKLLPTDKYAKVAVGYYPDLDGEEKFFSLNKDMIVSGKSPFTFYREGSHPLCLLLEQFSSSQWNLWFPKDENTCQEIPFRDVSADGENRRMFVFQKAVNNAKSSMCIFQASQEQGQQIPLEIEVCHHSLHPTVNQSPSGNPSLSQIEAKEDEMNLISQAEGDAPPGPSKYTLWFLLLKKNIAENWKDLGRHLDISENELSRISEQYKSDIEEGIYRMLICWQQKNYIGATREKLIEALKYIDRTDVAEKLAAL